jgi:large subunit ribosomal protein L21
MSYAIIKTGGKQYKVSEGDTLNIEKLEGEPGSEVTFDEVLFRCSGDDVTFGEPTIDNSTVTGEIIEQFKGPKVRAFKMKRRQGYHRTVGHRQRLTRVKITSL